MDSFQNRVEGQIALLRAGKPLQAFARYFAADGVMFANDRLFARGADEGHRKQAPFMTRAKAIHGRIEGLCLDTSAQVCVFRNLTRFSDATGAEHHIDGLCWQRWQNGLVAEERYYDGPLMALRLSEGILDRPGEFRPPA